MGGSSGKRTLANEDSATPRHGLPRPPLDPPHDENRRASAADAIRPSSSASSGRIEPRRVSDATALGPTSRSTSDDPARGRSSGLKQHLTTLWARRKSPQPESRESEAALDGPLGLHLIHEAPKPLIELIFVHGLRGGSIKTWRKGEDHRLFWPKYFLPTDPHFQDTNIYSFGYDSNWGSTKHSILNVHDFGNTLLEAMRTSTHLRNPSRTPIILIGHSMGGLVVKKAYISAREHRTDPTFAERIRCVFFLATPHRGSDYAAMLNNILKISGFLSSRKYLADLTTGSTSIELINEDFRKYADDLHIFSFFETLRMSLGVTSGLIVEKESAVLGSDFRTETVQYINANHRDVCKFEGVDDPNYHTVRDSLSAAMDTLLRRPPSGENVMDRTKQLATLQSYLGVKERAEDSHRKVEGSCQWIEHREDFQHWLSGGDTNPAFYVMTAQPGAGKTVLAAHVVSQLKELSLSCAHHFVQSGNDQEQSLAGLLRSIAYQMASANAVFRDALLRLHEDGSTFAMDDARTLWVKIFKKGLLQSSCTGPQYWIIDGLDECPKHQELFTYLKGERPSFQLRVMIISRPLPAMQRLLSLLAPNLAPVEIPRADTLKDIGSYVRSRADSLPVTTQEERNELSACIQAKSGACFLWVRLVLDELEDVYGFESIMDILEGIPEGMIPYYQRATGLMEERRDTEKRIAKAILRLVIAAARPLHTSELAEALELESRDLKLHGKVRSAIEGLCGHLVQVSTSESIQIVHLTAREFLLSEDAGEFQVLKSAAQERLASTCLALLSTPKLRPPAHPALLHQERPAPSALLDYAATYFSHHVYSSSSETEKLLVALYTFFKTNVQSWIEHVTRKGDLHCLLKTARNLRGYLDRRVKYEAPISMPVKVIGDWSTDLTRLVTRFGNALVRLPSSIYFLIPPLAPTTSAIHTQFGTTPGGMSVAGYDNVAWDDCLASVKLDSESSATLSCGLKSIAVGMISGDVILYNHRSFQKQRILSHGSFVDLLHYDRSGQLLVSSSRKRLAAWDREGEPCWEHSMTRSLVLLDSSESAIVGFTPHGHFLEWDLREGTLLGDEAFEYRAPGDDKGKGKRLNRAASMAAVSPEMDVLAIAYMARPVCLWLRKTKDFIGWAVDDRGGHPVKLMFNPNPQVTLLLVAYRDCHLTLFHSYSGARVLSTVGDHIRQVGLLDATISLDGRTVAAVDRHGLLSIRDFETLNVLYHISSPDSMGRTLQFSLDSSSLVDVAETSMRVWSPSALNRKPNTEGSISDEAVELPPVEGQFEADRAAQLTIICAHPSRSLVVAGRRGGEVVVYSSVTGKEAGLLYSHQKSAHIHITALALGEDDLVASGDTFGNVVVCELDTSSPTSLKAGPVRFRAQLGKAIRKLYFVPGLELLLVATADMDRMFSLDGTCRGERESDGDRSHFHWVSDHGNSQRAPRLFLIQNRMLRQFDVTRFPEETGEGDIYLDYEGGEGVEETAVVLATIHDNTLVIDTRRRQGYAMTCCPLIFDLSNVQETETGHLSITPSPLTSRLASKVQRTVVPRPDGASRGQLMFLSNANWVTSVSLAGQDTGACTQYFPVPNEFAAYDGGDEVLPVRTVDDDVVFSLRGELAVVRNGLKHEDVTEL